MTTEPYQFTLDELYEELTTIVKEKTAFIDGKEQKRTISKEEAGLARYRIERIKAAAAYILRHRQAEKAPAPRPQQQQKKPEPAAPAVVDDFDD